MIFNVDGQLAADAPHLKIDQHFIFGDFILQQVARSFVNVLDVAVLWDNDALEDFCYPICFRA